MEKKREKFGSRMAVIFAMAGSAIGLGNIWRFPYIVGEHGGAAFVLIYIVSTLLISMPVFVAEVSVGRRSRTSAYGALSRLSPNGWVWKAMGLLTVFIPLMIASYYSVIGGWSVNYLIKACSLSFLSQSPDEVTGMFGTFISSSWTPLVFHMLFLAACCMVVAGGVKSGIEKFSKLTIPMLFVLVLVILVYSVTLPGASSGVNYLLRPDFSQLTPRTFAYALGQSFYSLSLGMGCIITYGSYVSSKENILASSAGTAVSDLLFAILAGFAIMPAVFAAGIEPGAGPGLIFQSIPFIFTKMGMQLPLVSTVVSVLFFLTIVVAAMTSCISLVEVGVAYLWDRYSIRRPVGSLIIFMLCGLAGVLCSLSFGPLSSLTVGGKCIFDLFDWFASNILLLLAAFAVVVFVGFVMKKEDVWDEVTNSGAFKVNVKLFNLLYFLIKWVAPAALTLIFITNFIY